MRHWVGSRACILLFCRDLFDLIGITSHSSNVRMVSQERQILRLRQINTL